MKPRIFIGSSVENIDVAYAAQECLEHTCEATVWDQGIFQLSRSSMASLIDVVGESDFGLFIFAPDDVTNLRNKDLNTVRDNVVFELGLFIGKLGQERNFIIVPRGVGDFHLPTDLLGITPGEYEAGRQDGNLVAALGPAMNRVRKAIARHGKYVEEAVAAEVAVAASASVALVSDGNDCVSLIQSWLGARSAAANTRAIKLSDVDRELGLEPGSARTHIRHAAAKFNYTVAREGAEIVMLEYQSPRSRGSYF